jgi:pyruvate dehydrogenase kinase 2/3/4
MSWKKSERLMDTIKHYSGFPATGVSLRQMVQFGERPSTGECVFIVKNWSTWQARVLRCWNSIGTLFRASQFLSEELPIRLAHRVQELGDLPDGLNDMPSIKKVQDWYAQSFEV